MSDALPTAVLRAEPDGYDMGKKGLMGRQSAGNGFLRAAVLGRGEGPIQGVTANGGSARQFGEMVRAIDPAAEFEWIHSDHLQRIANNGVYYLADLTVPTQARLRLRIGVDAYSLCGVTHTTASLGAMDEIVALAREAVMPWDALVCTSTAVVETVRRVHAAESDYLRWRFGDAVRFEPPQLPIIPLGVHCEDFAYDDTARDAARQELGLEPDEVTALFVGRLIFHGKAHPYPMFRGLQEAAKRTGQRVALLMVGWAPNDEIARAFRSGAEQFAPDVRVIFLEGRDGALRDRAWAASDLFISLSDNIQETFGLTPIEAMAAGLPVVVSDWDGYKDTVRDGVDGFRVRTLTPDVGAGQALARAVETRSLTYDAYCWAAGASTVVDIAGVTDALSKLVADPALRRQMGDAGRRRAQTVFDWPVIYRQYQALWVELNARRRAAREDAALSAMIAAAPKAAASRLDPFLSFGHYPTQIIRADSRMSALRHVGKETLDQVLSHGLFGSIAVPRASCDALYAVVASGDLTLAEAATRLNAHPNSIARAAGLLAKIGVIDIR